MITYKCPNCAGEMTIGTQSSLKCPYCGSKVNLSDAALREYHTFRKQMLEYLAAMSDKDTGSKDIEAIFTMADKVHFVTKTGDNIDIKYIYESTLEDVTMYSARNTVAYVFGPHRKAFVDRTYKAVNSIDYPQADMKNLKGCIPTFLGRYDLSDDSTLLVCSKPEHLLPLPLFANLHYNHVAWIISRLENIACLLGYNGKVHGLINPDTIFINPQTHEASLLGGWWNLADMDKHNSATDLYAIRKTASMILGDAKSSIPKMFIEFLDGTPQSDAFKDFTEWDRVIEEGLGGRRFHKLTI